MSWWDTHALAVSEMEKLGPFLDGIVGTEGKYTDLYAAINTGGWTRMIVTPTATLSANLTISSHIGFIWALGQREGTVLSNYKITISGNYWKIVGIKLASGAAGWELQGHDYDFENCAATGGSSHGLYLNSSSGGFIFRGCSFLSNAGDGIKIAVGSLYNQFVGCDSHGNTGYGVNSAVVGSGYSIFAGCRLGTNTAGSVSGTITEGNYKP